MPLEQKYRPLRFPRKARKGGKKLGPFSNSGCMIPNVPTFPLIAFVHVPKTGGSTVNKLLHLCSPRGLAHVHSEPFSDAGAFLDLASDCDWLSGHFRRDEFAAKLIWLDRPVDYFASVREPSAQLVSALNWQFEILSEGIEFFLGYPLQSQAVMAEVTSTDFSNLSAVMALLLNPANTFFLNVQSRYVLGEDFAWISDSEKVRRLKAYRFIATEDLFPALYSAFGFAEVPPLAGDFRENVASNYHFDTKIFQTPELQAFLACHHRHDFRLYELVRQTVWSAQKRRLSRPTYNFVTPHNFDESNYLAANPDVAMCVRNNVFPSGRDHFYRFGNAEGRRQLVRSPLLQKPLSIGKQQGSWFKKKRILIRNAHKTRLKKEPARRWHGDEEARFSSYFAYGHADQEPAAPRRNRRRKQRPCRAEAKEDLTFPSN